MSTGESDRVCLLTGASGTLGRSFCERYADRYRIVAVYRRNHPPLAAQDARFVDPLAPDQPLPDNDRPLFALQADLLDEQQCERVVEAALARYERIDLVVNAAVSSVWAPMLGSDRLLRTARAQLATNVIVPLQVATVVARRFWQGRAEENRREGRNVVNVSSIAGLHVYPGSGQSMYAASKAALDHLTAHMALEFGTIGVRVNATAANSFPSIVPTERAVDAIVGLDEGTATGTIVVVDGDADRQVQTGPHDPSAPT